MGLFLIEEQQIQMLFDFVLDEPEETCSLQPDLVGFKKRAADLLLRLRFAPMGDNHHNAALCPYCSLKEG